MYDPQNRPPSFDRQAEPYDPQRGKMIFWASMSLLGALILIIGTGVLIVMVFIPGLLNVSPSIGELFPAAEPPAAIEEAEEDAEEGPPEPPPVAPEIDEESLPSGPVRLSEDFDEPTTRWDQSFSEVRDGAYEIRLDLPNNDRYGLFLGARGVQDFDMAVDATQTAGDLNAEYGIRFRQSGPENYLLFSISSSGYYRLVRVVDQEYESLVPWTFDEDLNTGLDAVNRLRVVAEGENITASINGKEVIEEIDENPVGGQLTLGVGTYDEGDLIVRFDNIEGEVLDNAPGGLPVDLTEDFEDPESVPWSIGGARILDEGVYEMFAGSGLNSWQHPLPTGTSEVGDFRVEVETTLIAGASDTAYGIIFGDGGEFDFYALFVTPDGLLTIVRNTPQGNALVLQPQPVQAWNDGLNETNIIELEVTGGTTVSITVNGEELPSLESSLPIEPGMVGMIVSSGVEGRVQVQFDNFTLEELIDGDDA